MSDPVALHNEGVTLRKAERFDAALEAFDLALARGGTAIETRVMRAHVLADLGRFDDAIVAYRALLADDPACIDAHETLSRLLPQLGRAAEALDSYREALAVSPGTGMLWVSALGAARALSEFQQLLDWANAAERRFGLDSMVSVMAAIALAGLEDGAAARAKLEAVIAADPDYAPAYTSLAYVLIKMGHVRTAEAPALEAVRRAPLDQAAWALLATVWRVTGNSYEHWLAGYERLVMPIALDGLDLASLSATLTARHRTLGHPGDQSLRGGTQTRGILFDSPDPDIRALVTAIRRGVEARLSRLPFDAKHPFLARNSGRIDFAGSWSVRLRGEGRHVSHIHQEGWLSSALYIGLPPEMAGGDQGALVFGVPDAALKLDLPPRRMIRPEPGMLVIFPSYLWHGTTPFESAAPRLTVAFDALPRSAPQSGRALRSTSRV